MADLGLLENFLEHARVMEGILYRRRSVALRNMELAFEMPDPEFIGLYRLNKSVCRDLIQELEPYLPTTRGGISTTCKVLSALSFYASGSYQRFIGASAHNKMHQVSVSNSMRAVTLALNNEHFRRKYIHFPQTREERNTIKHGFYQKFGMPGVVGCIDGTHIAIVKPAEFEERFFNRKRYHSLNAQIVCDSDLNILSIDASHGGADHDSFVWNYHPLKSHLEQLHQAENETVWLLGDSGYPLRSTLLTPIIETEPDSPQRYYTELHCRVRNTVERCIGVLKSRWRCLLVDRKLHYHPTTAGFITNACVVLHNIANAARLPETPLAPHEEQNESVMQIRHQHNETSSSRINDNLAAGEQIRNALIARLWSAQQH
ncbi:hypothetical protein ABMA28_000160 [Loxostege sticticalis]|uniref:DDE Tnp4 domain-containing protein n=1 Tax=Loxostege sticticalis TaxID=481309 RepID=A0ABD0TR92_LOXSC